MHPPPLISVIVPTYNRPALLQEALTSLSQQDLREFEVIVVNDCGADVRTVVSSAEAALPRITLIEHSENKGLPAARNTAVRASSGKFLAYLDDDDLFLPNHLSGLYQAANSFSAVWYTDCCDVWISESASGKTETKRELVTYPDFDRDKILLENFASVPCIFHPRTFFDAMGGFDENLTALEDWDLWLRMSRAYPFRHLAQASCEVRRFIQVDSLYGSHQHGYAWAAVNAIHKYFPYVADKPELAAHYRLKISEGLEHLNLLVLDAIPEKKPLKGIFGRHSVETVLARLNALQAIYGSDAAAFCELRGVLQIYRGDFEAAERELSACLQSEPDRLRAKDLLSYIQPLISSGN